MNRYTASHQRSAYSITSVITGAIHQIQSDCGGEEREGERERGLIPGGHKPNHKTNMIIEI